MGAESTAAFLAELMDVFHEEGRELKGFSAHFLCL